MSQKRVSPADIAAAAQRMAGKVVRTPLVFSKRLSEEFESDIWLKPETLQPTGSFKIRGATNAINRLSSDAKAHGVVTASSGNHGPALAAAAAGLGVECTVCLSQMVPANKVDNVLFHGGKAHVAGRDFDASVREAERISNETGAHMIHAFDHPDIVAGAGTVGKEIITDLPDVDQIIVPLSGGGLLAGTAIAVKAARPGTRLFGVSMQAGASMHESLAAGKPVDVVEQPSLADALGGNIGLNNTWTFPVIRDLVDQTHLVSEALIAQAMSFLLFEHGLVCEGAGAVGIAALLGKSIVPKGKKTVIVLSGRNVDRETLVKRALDNGL